MIELMNPEGDVSRRNLRTAFLSHGLTDGNNDAASEA